MTRKWTRGAGIVAVCVTALAVVGAAAWARQAVVVTKDGKSFEGDVTENEKTVVIIAKGGTRITLNKANVASIEAAASSADQFRERMAKLEKTDAAGHVELAKWAVDRKEYDLALDALDAAIAIDPNNEEARQMSRSVQKQRKLNRDAAAAAAGKAGAQAPPTAGQATTPPKGQAPAASEEMTDDPAAPAEGGARRGGERKKTRLVTADEINRIRQLELQKGENVRLTLQGDVARRYQQSSEFTPQQFAKLSPQDKAYEILSNGSRDMKKEVVVAQDPASIAQFKSAVQRNVLPGCAASACHTTTNPKAGDFVLHNPANKDAETYTNFLLMHDYKGSADDKEYSMIDRQRPEDSLLLQFGLPQGSSGLPHPKVQNFRPIFKGKSDPRYRAVEEWLTRTLAPVAPEYGIDLTKEPDDGATTRPARRRAETPAE